MQAAAQSKHLSSEGWLCVRWKEHKLTSALRICGYFYVNNNSCATHGPCAEFVDFSGFLLRSLCLATACREL